MGKARASQAGAERRRSPRRQILDAFGVFVVVPSLGAHRLRMHDVSDLGLGFDMDLAGEVPAPGILKAGQELPIQLHFNAQLSLSLVLRISRIEESVGVRRVGGEITGPRGREQKAFCAFVDLVDALLETGHFGA